VVSANNINDGLKVDGFPTTSFGVIFDRRANVEQIEDGDFNDVVNTAGILPP
jgi:hypothetical protein